MTLFAEKKNKTENIAAGAVEAAISPNGLSPVELEELSKSMLEALQRTHQIAQGAEEGRERRQRLESLPLLVQDGISPERLADRGIELNAKDGLLKTPIRIEKFGDKESTVNMQFHSDTSHLVLSKGESPGTYELRVVDKSSGGTHSEQVFTIKQDGKVVLSSELRTRDEDIQITTADKQETLAISPQKNTELYNAVVAARQHGLELSLERKRPGVLTLALSNSLGAVQLQQELKVIEIGGEQQILMDQAVQGQLKEKIAAAANNPQVWVPESIQKELTALKREGLFLKVQPQKAVIFSLENALGTNHGSLSFGGIEVSALSNLPSSLEGQAKLLEFLQRTRERAQFVK